MTRAFCDTSVLIRYFAEDDIPRAVAAATIIDSDTTLVVSTGVMLEALHVLRSRYEFDNPGLGELFVRFLMRTNVELVDADRYGLASAIHSTLTVSARRIGDAIIAAAAARAHCDVIVSFDQKFGSGAVPVRLL